MPDVGTDLKAASGKTIHTGNDMTAGMQWNCYDFYVKIP
jgi:hypothetical protein